MANGNNHKRHLRLDGTTNALGFRGRQASRNPAPSPARNRQAHAAALRYQLAELEQWMPGAVDAQRQLGLDAENGIIVEFSSEPDFDLAYESLDLASRGIQLLAVTNREGIARASVFVPDGELGQFVNRIEQYGAVGRNRALVESISEIGVAALESLWTDPFESLPPAGVPVWWEVWFRKTPEIDFAAFAREHAHQMGLEVGLRSNELLDRQIVLIRATRESMAAAIEVLSGVAELRRPQANAEFFTGLPLQEQADWMLNLSQRLRPPPAVSPYICVLDTGVNHAHQFLAPVIAAADVLAFDPTWNAADTFGHGTEMAGLACMGDLTPHLAGAHPVDMIVRLESCKMFDPALPHSPTLYGSVTRSGVATMEIANPQRTRVFLCAVTADESDGSASEWSSTVDALASGSEDATQRLFVVAGGNADPNLYGGYITSNLAQGVENPAQAWNALTVGAYTTKWQIDPASFPGVQVVATPGDLSPCSRTSNSWPNRHRKPDVVMEGGNVGVNPANGWHYDVDSLQLLTTGHAVTTAPLVTSFGTSPATALAANLAGNVFANYPGLRPETVRGLIVHSADWTPEMHAQFSGQPRSVESMLSVYGYGVPDYEKLLWSASNSLTLIIESELQPFELRAGRVEFKEMHFHDLPWPTQLLEELGDTPVELRATLSYFVEPSPARRGGSAKFRYASHGLRFDLRRPGESPAQMIARINAAMDEQPAAGVAPDRQWVIGSQLRSRGSLHSDMWLGAAADLAARNRVAIYPVSGWWRYRRALERYGRNARYSLILSISTPEVGIDLYTPIANAIGVAVPIEM